MKTKPIIFSGPMVRAILEGRKTMTRRIVRIPEDHFVMGDSVSILLSQDATEYKTCIDAVGKAAKIAYPKWLKVPYQPGDLLWVRESFYEAGYFRPVGIPGEAWEGDVEWTPITSDRFPIQYVADVKNPAGLPTLPERTYSEFQYHWRKKPSIHMPREASRITLEVTAVRCERLQDITEEDSMREGLEDHGYSNLNYLTGSVENIHPRESFMTLWQSIHGPESWDANPWVWVYEFRRVKP